MIAVAVPSATTHHRRANACSAWVAALAALAWALSPAVASAEGADGAAARAMELYRAAQVSYREGDYEAAVALLTDAIELHDAAALHYNLGRSYQELRRWGEARAEYVAFLESDPDSPQRAQVEERIAEIDRLTAEPAPEPAPPPEEEPELDDPQVPPPQVDAPPRRVAATPWVLFGLGVLSLGTGVAMGALFLGQMNLAEDPGATPDEAAAALDRAENYSTAATITLVVGGGLAIAGLVWGIIDLLRSRDARQARAAPAWARRLVLTF